MWLGSGSSERGSGSGDGRGSDDAVSRRASSREEPEDDERTPSPGPALVDASHAGTLSAGCEGLFRSTERALQWAWRLLQLTKGGPEAGVLVNAARASAIEFLDRIPPHVRRSVAELLGYSSLWEAVCTRLGRPQARSHEELLRELGEDLQLLLRGAQARLGTAAALEQGVLVHVGRLREARASEPGAPLELRAVLDAFTHALSEVMAAASAYRRAWEAAEAELSESAAWLGAGDPGFCAWLVEHLSGTVAAWRQAHASARMLRELGALAGPP
ncbi:hypothetical protein HPC49_53445 [Pyxidicoccus fallax]|uniref:Uncharacterized protein n=1 Tax=Pyxidicoccus fallax TaxID=394095 RepID=A0A848LZD2_9BACT|nr:hypothetical protein [Pyxidicoccus fallax]NMO23578.1 hypothetical protein [Pyxidicoccus fallax]NPC86977.1 hypothetical protein [Pyxidicoccus fallax]